MWEYISLKRYDRKKRDTNEINPKQLSKVVLVLVYIYYQ